jgi:hypothetical protein
MGNAHPFYRFNQAWNAGFYPDNQIVSDLLNEVHAALTTALPSIAIPGTTTIYQLRNSVQQIIDVYNASPIFGDLVVDLATAPDPPLWEYHVYVRNTSLYVNDNTQILDITGYFNNTTKVLSGATLLPFTPGSYTGTFAAPLIAEELRVKEALNVVNLNGSAIFPITYSFDPLTNIATSGLARGSNWQLVNDEANRLPAPTAPYENQRTFSLPQLSADDSYVLTIMERIIEASLNDSDWTTSVLATYYTYAANEPDGWIFSVSSPAFTTYRRAQFTFNDTYRRKFILVGRLDGGWLWQRFVSDLPGGAFNFLGSYSELDQLPYEPNLAGRWLYDNSTYDLEFVEFTSGCYVSEEFYAMPAKPGDQWQFNVVDGNLASIVNASVGLFTEDGQFIQQIGTAVLPDDCNNTQMQATVTIPSKRGCYRMGLYNIGSTGGETTCELVFNYLLDGGVNAYVDQINENYEAQFYTFGLFDGTNYSQEYSIQVPLVSTGGFSVEDIVDWSNTIPGMVCTYDSEADTLEWTWTVMVECDTNFSMRNYIADDDGNVLDEQFSTANQLCECEPFNPNLYELYSLSNIINIDASDCFSTLLEYWSDSISIAEGFEYTGGWKQKVRLGINGGGAKPVIEESLYRQSNGVHRRPQSKQDLSLDLHTDFLDEATQLALVDATRHSNLIWEGKSIFVKGDIEVATTQDYTTQSSFETLSQVKFQALVQGFQPKNSSCLNC